MSAGQALLLLPRARRLVRGVGFFEQGSRLLEQLCGCQDVAPLPDHARSLAKGIGGIEPIVHLEKQPCGRSRGFARVLFAPQVAEYGREVAQRSSVP